MSEVLRVQFGGALLSISLFAFTLNEQLFYSHQGFLNFGVPIPVLFNIKVAFCKHLYTCLLAFALNEQLFNSHHSFLNFGIPLTRSFQH